MTGMAARELGDAPTGLVISLLPASAFEEWDALVTRSPHGTIFHTSWWLRATGTPFEILGARDARGVLVAGIPLPWKRRLGMRLLHPPKLTPYLGPVFDVTPVNSTAAKYALMRDGGELLARSVKGFDSLEYDLGPMAPDLQGFLWSGYRVTVGYTYWIERGSDPQAMLNAMTQKTRNKLARAERAGIMVASSNDFGALFALVEKTFARQRIKLPFDPALPQNLFTAAASRGNAELYLARTAEGETAAGAIVVHDARNSYYLMGGDDERFRSLGAGNCVQWYAVRQALAAGRAYDFEGSVLRGVERYFRGWGAAARPAFTIAQAGSLRGLAARLYLEWKCARDLRKQPT